MVILMTYAEKLSILLTNQQLKNIIEYDGPRSVNQYGKDQARQAYQYWNDDANVIYKLLDGRSGEKFKQLFSNGQAVFDYLNKYHSLKYAMGALAMMILRATKFDKKQTNRILHRSRTFKFWSNPNNSPAGKNLEFINWDKLYMTTNMEPDNAQTHGEIYLENLIIKMKQPMGV